MKKSWVRNGGAKASPVGIVVVYGSERELQPRISVRAVVKAGHVAPAQTSASPLEATIR